MAQNIQITTQVNLDDSQFKNKTREVLDFLKTMTKTKALLKLKFDAGDVRKELQAALSEAYRGLEKAYGVKAGQKLTYKGPKGALRSVNTKQQQERALEYFSGRMEDTKLSVAERNQAQRIVEAHRAYNNLQRQIQDLDRRARRAFTNSLDEEESEGKRRAREHKERTRTWRRGRNISTVQEEVEQARAYVAKRGVIKGFYPSAENYGKEIQALQQLISKKKELFRLEGRRKTYSDAEVKDARARIEALKLEKADLERTAKLTRERQQYNKAVFQANVSRRREQQRAAKEAQRSADQSANAQNRLIRQYQTQYGILGGLKSRLASYLSIYAVANFGRKVAEVTGYFEKQQVALEGILGSASKAQTILSQIKSFALQSPFQTKELVNFTKQLSAFSIPADELFDTTKRLADISAGLGVDMGRIILAYGQVRSAAVLRGQELRQFTEAGIPLVKALADKFTQLRGEVVTTADVFELISKRQVSFQMVADVLADMTKEGGKFYKMQENITNTLYGQMQKLQDMWTIELDNLGKGTNMLMNIVKLLQLIIKHTGGVATGLATAFTLGKFINGFRRMRMEWDLMDASMKRTLSRNGINTFGQFQKFNFKQFAGNLGWGVAAAGVGLAVGAIFEQYRKATEVTRKMNEISESFNKETNKMVGGFDDLVKRLRSATKGSQAYNDAIETLKTNYGEFLNVNDATINALRGEGQTVAENIEQYKKYREQVAAAIQLKQQFNELKTQKETLAGLLGDKAKGSDFWGTGYEGVNKNYAALIGRIVGGANTDKGSAELNRLFGTNYSGNVLKKLEEDLDNLASKTLDEFTSSVEIPSNFADMSDEEKKKYLLGQFKTMYGRNFSNEFLFNTLSQSENESLKRFSSTLSDKIFADMSSSNVWTEFIDAAKKMAGNGTNLLSAMIRINNEFDKYNAAENEGQGSVGKQEWTNKKYIELLSNASQEFAALGGDADKLEALKNLLAKPYGPSSIKDITDSITEFMDTIEDSSRREVVANAIKRFKEGTDVLTEQEAKIATRMELGSTWGNINRGTIKGVNLQTYLENYHPAALGEQTVLQTREKLRKEYEDLRKDLKTYTAKPELFKDDIALINAKMRIIERLAKNDLYAVDITEKGKKDSIGGGWRRMFSDLFGYIKEARAEEKKLVEHSAGLTEELAGQIYSGKLAGTAVQAFWSSGSPFKNFIDKMDQYDLESEVFSKGFLQNKLNDIITKSIESTGTIDYENVWEQLIGVLNERLKELSSNPKMKSTVDSMKAYLMQMVQEQEKFFGKNRVENLIEQQLKELRSMNAKFDAERSKRDMFNRISGSSNFLRATSAIGGQYSTYFASGTTQSQLRAFLTSGVGAGISQTKAGEAISRLFASGDLSISSLTELSRLRFELTEEVNKMKDGSDAEKAVFKDLNGVIGQFDNLLKQLLDDIIKDFEELMQFKDPITKGTDEIVEAYKRLVDAQTMVKKGIKDGTITGSQAERIRINALQESYRAVVKDMPSYLSSLYGEENNKGYNKTGLGLGLWLGGSLGTIFANKQYEWLQKEQQDIENKFDNVKYLPELTGDEREKEKANALAGAAEKAAEAVTRFSAKLELTSAIMSKLNSYIQKGTQFANKLIGALEANNRLYRDSQGEYRYQNDYTAAKYAVNTISEFSSGISEVWKDFWTLDWGNMLLDLGSTIAGFFENLFGFGDALKRKEQEENTRSINRLNKSIDDLNHYMHEAVGNLKFDNLVEQIKLLEEEEELLRANADIELSMKHGDDEKAKEFEDNADKTRQRIEEIIWEIQDTIFGTVDEIASKLTDSLVEAFKNGENAARSWRNAVREYVGDVLKQLLMTNVLAPRIDAILERYGIGKDTTSDEIMRIFNNAATVRDMLNSLNAEGTFLTDWFNNLPDIIKETIAWNSDTSALSGGIQGITEDTARTLEGLSNSMLAQLVLIQRSSVNMESFAEVQTNQFRSLLSIQSEIRGYAKDVCSIMKAATRDGQGPISVSIV